MNILLVIDSLTSGGAQRQITALASGLLARGHSVTLYHYYPALDHFRAELLAVGVTLVDGNKPWRYSLTPARQIAGILRRSGIDIVIAFMTTPGCYALIATLLNPRVPVIVSQRGDFETPRASFLDRLRFALYRRAASITVNSWHLRDSIAERFPQLSEKIRVIYNGVDIVRYKPWPPASDKHTGTLKLLCIASLHQLKNALGMIEATAVCADAGLAIEISWLGRTTGSVEVEQQYQLCVARLQELGIESQWQWAGVQQDVAPWLARADALIHPSRQEGLPNAICEALACGKIVLAGDVGDHRLLLGVEPTAQSAPESRRSVDDNVGVLRGIRGFVFDPNSAASIGAAINALSQLTAADRTAMSMASRRYAETHLAMERLLDDYEQLAASVSRSDLPL